MLYADGVLALLELCLLVYAAIDVITTPETAVRNLPKLVWLLVILVPWAGPIAWLVAGRPARGARPEPTRSGSVPPEYDRPGRAQASNPDDDEAFLRGLRDRAEEQRRRGADRPRPEDA